jgi:hypothetical protein
VLYVLDRQMCVLDVMYTHPASFSQRHSAARSAGAAAKAADVYKRRKYRDNGGVEGYTLVPFSIETDNRLGKPAMQLVNKLGHIAEENSKGLVPASAFVSRVLQELAVVGVEYAARIETTVASNLALAEGQDYMAGDAVPESDVSGVV